MNLRWQYLALVWAGGTVGAALRELLTITVPPIGDLPVATFGINIVGALGLGILLESLTRRGPDDGRRRGFRLLLGAGLLGGFTTYSALATDSGLLLASGMPVLALGYALGTVIVGGVATWTGIAIAAAVNNRSRRMPSDGIE